MVFVRIPCATQLPAVPGNNITFNIPAGEGFCDMTRSRFEFDVTPSGTGVPALLTPGGLAAAIRHIEVQTLNGGVVLERIQNYNVIAAAVGNVRSNSTAAYRELVFRESISDPHQWLNWPQAVGTTSATIAPKRCYVDLGLLGLGRWAELPVAALGGLRIDIVLAPASQVFDSWRLGGPPVNCNDLPTTAKAENYVTLKDGEMCYPNVDYGRSRLEFPFQAGDVVVVRAQTTAEPPVVVAQQMTILTVEGGAGGSAAGAVIVFTDPMAQFADNTAYTNVTIRRQPLAATWVSTTTFTLPLAIADVPLYVGQVLSVTTAQITQTDAEPPVFVSNVSTETPSTTIAGMAFAGGLTTVTVDEEYGEITTDDTHTGNMFIFGADMLADVNYSITAANLRVCRVDIPAEQAARVAGMRQLALPIVTMANMMATYPSGARINHTITTPMAYHDALGIASIPVKSDGSTWNDSVRGQRDIWSSYRYTIAGQSDPLQPIDVSRPRPTVADQQANAFWSQLSAAVAQSAAPASLPTQDRLAPFRQMWAFYKALNSGGAPRNIVSQMVQLEIDSSGAASSTTLQTYVVHERLITIEAGNVMVE